jgi:5-formyltetrahydrofolate cyclo-ligase
VSKLELRKKFKAQLLSMRRSEFEKISIKISFNLNLLLQNDLSGIKKLGMYWPLKDEFILSLDGEFEYCVPEINGLEMIYKLISKNELKENASNYTSICSGVEVVPDIIIVPGLAFSTKGFRLGRGKGFFDRYLENYQGIKVGVCSEGQLINSVPTEDHDISMNYIITERRIYQIKEE